MVTSKKSSSQNNVVKAVVLRTTKCEENCNPDVAHLLQVSVLLRTHVSALWVLALKNTGLRCPIFNDALEATNNLNIDGVYMSMPLIHKLYQVVFNQVLAHSLIRTGGTMWRADCERSELRGDR